MAERAKTIRFLLTNQRDANVSMAILTLRRHCMVTRTLSRRSMLCSTS